LSPDRGISLANRLRSETIPKSNHLMKPTFILSLLGLLSLVCSTQATVTVTVNSNGGLKFVTSGAANLTQASSFIRVGTFDVSGGTGILTSSNSYAALDALFTPLIENEVGGGNILAGTPNHGDSSAYLHIHDTASAGHVFAQLVNINGTYLPLNTQLYLWVLNVNQANAAAATEWAIVSSTSVLWDFPPDNGSTTLSTASADVVYRGTAGVGTLALALIPEPSALLLAIGGTFLFLARRRRS